MNEKTENIKIREDLGKSEVRGANLMSYFMTINDEKIGKLLAAYGFNALEPEKWYSMAKANGCLEVIADESMVNLVTWGMEVGRFVASQIPEGVPLPAVIENLDNTYREGHRGEEIGGFAIVSRPVDGKFTAEVRATTPYPDDFEFGIFYSIVNSLSKGEYGIAYGTNEKGEYIRREMDNPYTVFEVKPRENNPSKRFARN